MKSPALRCVESTGRESFSSAGIRQVAPLTPADTDDALAEIGYSAAEIAAMRTERVI